jgi:hypothetical protein
MINSNSNSASYVINLFLLDSVILKSQFSKLSAIHSKISVRLRACWKLKMAFPKFVRLFLWPNLTHPNIINNICFLPKVNLKKQQMNFDRQSTVRGLKIASLYVLFQKSSSAGIISQDLSLGYRFREQVLRSTGCCSTIQN